MDNLKQAVNPYLPSWEYVPDGEPYVFGNRVYVYGSHDFFGGDVYCMGDYVGWSAPVDNLGDWRYEGVIYRKDQDPGNGDLQGNLYAPDVTVGPDGRYYLYYVLSSWGIVSVAVCDELLASMNSTAMYIIRTARGLVKRKAMSRSLTPE